MGSRSSKTPTIQVDRRRPLTRRGTFGFGWVRARKVVRVLVPRRPQLGRKQVPGGARGVDPVGSGPRDAFPGAAAEDLPLTESASGHDDRAATA
ncbi:hypothetical protein [Streptomyces lutosisoli]|uniref:Uncharacterized protein n=1 Tax=Streptomyces lutosisoli TaxID=2665721 RepID=A0ABW2W1E1_9ACTN